ncbi:hypothetical protein ScPMuIL_007644 [Solemya velum]
MDIGNGAKKQGLPKLRDLLRRQRGETEMMNETPDLEFIYDDADTYSVEIAELYSYTEECEYAGNRSCFEEGFQNAGTIRSIQRESSPKSVRHDSPSSEDVIHLYLRLLCAIAGA